MWSDFAWFKINACKNKHLNYPNVLKILSSFLFSFFSLFLSFLFPFPFLSPFLFFSFLILWTLQRAFESYYSGTMDICPLEYRDFCIWALCLLYSNHRKTNNTPGSPKPAFVQVPSMEQNLQLHWLYTMRMSRQYSPLGPALSKPIGLFKKSKKLTRQPHNTKLFHPLTLSAYLCIQIAPPTCFSVETTQIAGCDLVKRENAHKQGNVALAVQGQEQSMREGGRTQSQQPSLLSASPRMAGTALRVTLMC